MKKGFKLISILCVLVMLTTVLPLGTFADTDTHWEVRFVLNGGNLRGDENDIVEYVPKLPVNSRIPRLPESPRKEGYVFGGWFNEPELLTRWQWRPTTAAGNNNFNIINADKTLYAAWAEKEEIVNWVLKYNQTFDEPFNEPEEWTYDDQSFQDNYIWDSDGIGFYEKEMRRTTPANATGGATAPWWYRGAANSWGGGGNTNSWGFYSDLNSFTEWRKVHTYGQDNWLTIQQYGRGPLGADGPGAPYSNGGRFEARNGRAVYLTDGGAGAQNDAAIITNSNPLPPYYRVELIVGNIEAGGRAIDPATGKEPPISSAIVANDWLTPAMPELGRRAGLNGYQDVTTYSSTGSNFRSSGPWDAGNSPGNAVAENGFYFLGILDYPTRPNNNLHIHWRRKVVMDTDNNRATKSAGTGSAGWSSVWNVSQFQGDGSRYMTMIWVPIDMRDVNAMAYSTWATWFGQMSSNYYTYTQVGTQYSAVYMTDKYLPGEDYLMVVERTPEYYMLSMTGNWYHAGQYTYEWTKFNFGYSDPRDPKFNYGIWTWHFNQTPEELKGLTPPSHANMAAEGNKVYFRDKTGEYQELELWPADSGYPDYMVMGLPHINYYDAYGEFTDIKLYVSDSYLYDLDVTAGVGGSVAGTPAGSYNAVTDVSLTAVADYGYAFAGWTFIDVDAGLELDPASAELNFTMPIRDVKLVANFMKIEAQASVVKLSGNKNQLTVVVTEYLLNGEIATYTEIFMIDNNAAAAYAVGNYHVYVDTKGNDQIRSCYFV